MQTKRYAIITHSADADGRMSEAIALKFTSSLNIAVSDTYPWDNGEPSPDLDELSKADVIIMADIAVPEVMADERLHDKLIWLDHHKTSIEKYEHLNLEGIRSTRVSACRLCWSYFFGNMSDRFTMDQAVQSPFNGEPHSVFLVGLYDTFQHVGTKYERDAELLNAYNRCSFASESALLADSFQLARAIELGGHYKNAITACSREQAMGGARKVKFEGLTFLTINTLMRGSQILQTVEWDRDVEGLMVWGVLRDGSVRFSLYQANSPIDMSRIAMKYGGGGHPGACGFRTNIETAMSIITGGKSQ